MPDNLVLARVKNWTSWGERGQERTKKGRKKGKERKKKEKKGEQDRGYHGITNNLDLSTIVVIIATVCWFVLIFSKMQLTTTATITVGEWQELFLTSCKNKGKIMMRNRVQGDMWYQISLCLIFYFLRDSQAWIKRCTSGSLRTATRTNVRQP